MKQPITAAVITCPGKWGDDTYRALEVSVEGVQSPFHCVLALPVVTCKAISRQVDPAQLYAALCKAINGAGATVDVN